MDGSVEINLEKILFSHDIPLSLQQTKWFFEMAKQGSV